MGLDVDPPEPPELGPAMATDEYGDTDAQNEEYRREELQDFLDEGAWADAFEMWAAGAEIDEREWRIVRDLELTREFDFFWDDFADRVGYHAPGLPEDWRERSLHPDIDSWGTVSAINAGLTELGQTVCDVLKDDYIDWESEFEASEDLPEF
jgi:hypothetical protein